VEQLRPLAISSTEIRELLHYGKSARYLLPEPVLDYIESNRLYR
jgi:nicotinate-nucleotide adenylyltransferase